jgi:2-haloalkanoic acid dehalogenase type II
MPTLDDFDALSFDCYGTLIDWETGIAAALAPWAAGHGLAATADVLVGAFSAIETHVEQERPTALYPDVLAETMRRIGERLGAPVTDEEAAAFGASVGDWPAFPDSADALARLHTRYRLIILSNVDRASFARSAARLGTDFDLVITAQDVGAYKPSPLSFPALLAGVGGLGVPRDRLLHVAESLYHDHVPAQANGLHSVWIDRRRGDASTASPQPGQAVTPDWTFTSMAAFAAAALPEVSGR